jgi:tetratricopeptide (TPR) repeat protein
MMNHAVLTQVRLDGVERVLRLLEEQQRENAKLLTQADSVARAADLEADEAFVTHQWWCSMSHLAALVTVVLIVFFPGSGSSTLAGFVAGYTMCLWMTSPAGEDVVVAREDETDNLAMMMMLNGSGGSGGVAALGDGSSSIHNSPAQQQQQPAPSTPSRRSHSRAATTPFTPSRGSSSSGIMMSTPESARALQQWVDTVKESPLLQLAAQTPSGGSMPIFSNNSNNSSSSSSSSSSSNSMPPPGSTPNRLGQQSAHKLAQQQQQQQPPQLTLQDRLDLVDQHHKQQAWAEIHTALLELRQQYGDSVALLWRYSRNRYHQSKVAGIDSAGSHQLLVEGIKAVQTAVALDDQCADCHKYLAILYSEIDQGSRSTKIANAHLFKRHTELALGLAPDDYDLHHMMGRFCFEVSCTGWAMRGLAAATVGALPDATFLQSHDYFIAAAAYRPQWPLNLLWLGKALVKLNNKQEARMAWQRALELDGRSSDDQQAQQECRELMASYAWSSP